MSRGTPGHLVRMADDLWRRFGRAAKGRHTTRAALIRKWVIKFVEDFENEEGDTP